MSSTARMGRQIAGLISTPVAGDQSYLKRWQPRTPMVFIDRLPSNITADSVVEDDYGGAYAATTHLIEHGHRKIGFIGDVPSIATTMGRLEGYRSALADAGINEDPRLVTLGVRSSGESGAASKKVASPCRPLTGPERPPKCRTPSIARPAPIRNARSSSSC